MKLKYAFEIVKMDGENIAVPVGEGASLIKGVFKLNNSGSEIMEMLKTDTSEENIIENLTKKYENDIQNISIYVHEMIKALKNAGVISE